MKKILALTLALCMVLALCACGKTEAPAVEDVEEKAEEVVAEVEELIEEVEAEVPAEEEIEEASEVMPYEVFAAADLDSAVVVEGYVQAKETWWDNVATFFIQSEDGAYLIYECSISEEDYNDKLVEGAKVKVSGFKSEWSGEVEVADGTVEFLDGTYLAEATDVTELFGTDELINEMNKLIAAKGVELVNDVPQDWDKSEDLYLDTKVNDADVVFVVRRYMTNADEVYEALKEFKAGDVLDLQCFLYWYEGPQARIVDVAAAE